VNERITLLALKASDPKTGWLDRQKFAELIVQECIDKVEVWETDSRNHISYMLKQHFGVEE
jgi:hypothetical protein